MWDSLKSFAKFRDALASACQESDIPFRFLVETSASISTEDRSKVSHFLADAVPCLFHAADFGWLHRPCLVWGLQEALRSQAPSSCSDFSSHPPNTLLPGLWLLRWLGLPDPPDWSPQDASLCWRYRGHQLACLLDLKTARCSWATPPASRRIWTWRLETAACPPWLRLLGALSAHPPSRHGLGEARRNFESPARHSAC